MKSIYKKRKIVTAIIAVVIIISMILGTIITAFADETKILTLGANLTDEQRQLIISYLGVNTEEVEVITVNNEDEHRYLGGIIPEQKIGKNTYSCTYIEPTTEGGIHIKTVNLNYVDCDMIRNALITSGITNANVICVSPIEVSGTGALVGVFRAYETIEGENLDEEKVTLASEELVATIEVSEELGKQEAVALMSELKEQVIEKGKNIDLDSILDMINKYLDEHNFKLTDEQKWKIAEILLKIAQQDYDIDEVKQSYQNLKDTIEKVKTKAEDTKNFFEKVVDFFKTLWQKITGTYEAVQENEKVQDITDKLGILAETNESLLGDSTIVTNTEQEIIDEITDEESIITEDEEKSFLDKIKEFFENLTKRPNRNEKQDSVIIEIEEEKESTQEEKESTQEEITFDSFNNNTTIEEDSQTFEDISNTSEGVLQYVTPELQSLGTDSEVSNETGDTNSNNSVQSFDEITK